MYEGQNHCAVIQSKCYFAVVFSMFPVVYRFNYFSRLGNATCGLRMINEASRFFTILPAILAGIPIAIISGSVWDPAGP